MLNFENFNNVPERYKTAIIEKTPTKRWNLDAHAACVEFLGTCKQNLVAGRAPAFLGVSGTGKTYAAAATVNLISQKLPDLLYFWAPVGETFNTMLDLKDFRDPRYWTLDSMLTNATLVVFDDFGHLQEYPRLRELFWICVNSRYDNNKATIFTANLPDWDAVSKEFGEHVSRRIKEMSYGLAVSL